MSSGQATWTRLHKLVQQARQAGAAQRLLEVELSPDESAALADVLEAALRMTTAVVNRPELEQGEPSDSELAYLAMQGGAFDWLAEEPELYSDEDLQERFEWATA
jgi:hypothetical protein